MSTTPTDSTNSPALPDKPKAKKTGRIVGIAAVALAVIVAVVLLVVNLTGGGGQQLRRSGNCEDRHYQCER